MSTNEWTFAGNKLDMADKREVLPQAAQDFAVHHNISETLETSAKENSNIDEAFLHLTKVCSNYYDPPSLRVMLFLLILFSL